MVVKLIRATINVFKETKKRFQKLKLDKSAKKGEPISEDELLNYLLNEEDGK